jgi:hypothetical protein
MSEAAALAEEDLATAAGCAGPAAAASSLRRKSMTESVRFSMSESASSAAAEEAGPGGESGCRSAERMVRMEWPGRRAGEEEEVPQGAWVGERIWEPAASETMAGVGGWGRARLRE